MMTDQYSRGNARLFVAIGAALWIAPLAVAGAQNPPPVVVTPPGRTAAQSAAAALGRDVSNAQIADALRQSGLSEAQVRERLTASGLDPALADPFFAARQAGAVGSAPSADFVRALQQIGILDAASDEQPDEGVPTPDVAENNASGVFGKDIFRRASTAFDPVTSGPVDPAYRLGVGDQLQLVLTGGVELAYTLDVRRDGTVIIPQVGQVSVAGLTLEGTRGLLRQRAGESYSGLRTGGTRLDLTIARIRTNAVFVIGEVEEPGAIQVNALGTVFHALARAGGPTAAGSFRTIELRRGGRTLQRFDLYDYLLRGDASQDVRLEQGDVVFVPLNTRAVAVLGAVRRPRVFELLPNEGFADLVRFAGGFATRASLDRVQIDRILPPERRQPGFERVKIDVRLDGQAERGNAIGLMDGDILTVFDVGDLRRNTVTVAGAVFQPGEYELRPGMTVDSLIARAQGLLPYAMRDRLQVTRTIPQTGRKELFALGLDSNSGGAFVLEEFDEVTVLDGRRDFPSRTVAVSGAVNAAGTLPYLEGESLRDLIDRAGGFSEGAQTVSLATRRIGAGFSDSTSVVTEYRALDDFVALGRAALVTIKPFDRVDVRLSPGYRPQRFVTVTGEFMNPGVYAITENVERIADVVRRAGGLLPRAQNESFQLHRDGGLVAVDFARAMRNDRNHNLTLRNGDEISISLDPQTVRVVGGVHRSTLVRYERGRSISDYIELAGGPVEHAKPDKAIVDYPSGFSQRAGDRRLLFFKSSPRVVSGAVITVPVETPREGSNAGEIISRTFQITSAIASLVIAYVAATK